MAEATTTGMFTITGAVVLGAVVCASTIRLCTAQPTARVCVGAKWSIECTGHTEVRGDRPWDVDSSYDPDVLPEGYWEAFEERWRRSKPSGMSFDGYEPDF